jgi:hypothetical protein
MPIEVSSGKTTLPAAVFLGLRQQCADLQGNALELPAGRLPHGIQGRIALEHGLDHHLQRCGGGQIGCDRGEYQTLQLVDMTRFSQRHQLSQHQIATLGTHQPQQMRQLILQELRRLVQCAAQQALDTYRQLARIKAAPPKLVAAHYLCEIASLALERGEILDARRLLRLARREAAPFPRAAILRAQIAERDAQPELATRLLRGALNEAPKLLQDELPHLLRLVGPERRDLVLGELVALAESRHIDELRRLAFAAIAADLATAAPLRPVIETVFKNDATLNAVWQAVGGQFERIALEVGALLSQAEKYRCDECGFAGRNFYWHCPACQSWDSFESCAIVKLR